MTRVLRWGLVVLGVIVLLGASGLVYYLTYTPDRAKYPVRGIDVSRHQGLIDWPTVARSDVSFAILKATEGGDHVDEMFERNLAGARAAGLAVGVYHFFTLCRPGAEQAANFLAAVPHDQPLLPPVIDLEFSGNCAARPSVDTLRQELADFAAPVEAVFGPVVLYVMDETAQQYAAALPDRPHWVRSIAWSPADGDWVYWQYHNAGHVDGISGDVDLNVLQGGTSALQSLIHQP
jgi:lysozyme